MRYVDSASRLLADTIYGWLQSLLPSARVFACQSGYYRFDALAPFAAEIQSMLGNGGRFDLVVGANDERLSAPDLERTLDLVGSHIPTSASFTLVGARDGLFHPKSYYVELANGRRHAAVGSANFTVRGVAHNVEACVLLEDSVDDPAALDAVRDAIVAWRDKAATGAPDARQVTPQYIQELEAERIIDPAQVPPAGTRIGASSTSRSSFPPLGPIPGVPSSQARAPHWQSAPGAHLRRARVAFPPNMVGIVKRLSARTDLKGFTGASGTLYIALPPNPTELASRLPMRPFGANNEPRLDLLVQARLYEAVKDVVNSGTDTTNITHVGTGTTKRSKIDLRFNILHTVFAGLRYGAAQHGLALPQGGDVVAIEFLEDGRIARLTFVSTDPMRATLRGLLHPGRAWGWLPAGVLPAW